MYDRDSGTLLYNAMHSKMCAGGGLRSDAIFNLNSSAKLRTESIPVNSARLLVSDPSMIVGTASKEFKQRIFDIHGLCGQAGLFAADINRSVSIKRIDVETDGDRIRPSLVGEVEVTQGSILLLVT